MFCGGETLTRNVISGRVFTAYLPLLSNVADENAIVPFSHMPAPSDRCLGATWNPGVRDRDREPADGTAARRAKRSLRESTKRPATRAATRALSRHW